MITFTISIRENHGGLDLSSGELRRESVTTLEDAKGREVWQLISELLRKASTGPVPDEPAGHVHKFVPFGDELGCWCGARRPKER